MIWLSLNRFSRACNFTTYQSSAELHDLDGGLIDSTDLQKASHSQYAEQATGRAHDSETHQSNKGGLGRWCTTLESAVYLEMCCVTWTIFAARNRALVLSYIGHSSCRTGR